MPSIRVCHIVKSLEAAFGGPAVLVLALCHSLRMLGAEAQIAPCSDNSQVGESGEGASPPQVPSKILRELSFSWKIFTYLGRSKADVFHSHGIWLIIHYAAYRIARSTKRSHVISIHGMLSKWALSQSRIKKSLAWRLFQKRALLTAACLHATCDAEVDEIRNLGIRTPIVLAPNGVNIPSPIDQSDRAVNNQRPYRMALFLSRIHQVKGLPILIRAWADVQPSNWRLVIAGPGSDRYISELNHEITKLNLSSSISIVGPVYGAAKDRLYREASLFVLPTYSENFGLVVAEALGYEIPVVTTTGTPWSGLVSHNCGWWVDPNPTAISKALVEATNSTPVLLQQMGARGRLWVERDFSWEQQAEKLHATYEWLVRGGVRPKCVIS